MPVDPTAIAGITQGPEWQVPGIAGIGPAQGSAPAATGATAGVEATAATEGFGDMLANQIQNLQESQAKGAEASRSLVEGTASDVSSVVMDVERAKLTMQLAAQLRSKGTEAYQQIFRTQV